MIGLAIDGGDGMRFWAAAQISECSLAGDLFAVSMRQFETYVDLIALSNLVLSPCLAVRK